MRRSTLFCVPLLRTTRAATLGLLHYCFCCLVIVFITWLTSYVDNIIIHTGTAFTRGGSDSLCSGGNAGLIVGGVIAAVVVAILLC